jgi:cell division protein FtsQ
VGSRILLTDEVGTLMELPGKKKYSFPVIVGMNQGEPPSTRAARMKIYNEVVRQLDAGGARYSQDLSEIDLSDPDDVKVLANNRAGEVLVHLGSANYLERYKVYVTHVQEWQQQFDKLESVDLRYDRQIIVNPDLQGTAKQPPMSGDAARKAMAAGVKPAALMTRISSSTKPSPAFTVKAPGSSLTKPAAGRPIVAKKFAKHDKTGTRQRTTAKARAKAKAKTGTAQTQKEQGQVRTAKKSPVTPATTAKANPASSQTSAKTPAKPSPAIARGEEPR